jgi:hypothetical protein
LANTEAGLQNSKEAVDDEDYVGDSQIVAASDTTFPQGNPHGSDRNSVVFKNSDVCLFFVFYQKEWLLSCILVS